MNKLQQNDWVLDIFIENPVHHGGVCNVDMNLSCLFSLNLHEFHLTHCTALAMLGIGTVSTHDKWYSDRFWWVGLGQKATADRLFQAKPPGTNQKNICILCDSIVSQSVYLKRIK